MTDLGHHGYKESVNIWGNPDTQGDPAQRKSFFGKYRGTVVSNADPLRIGRLLVQVPDVTGLIPSSWAMPCVPMAGPLAGTYFVPPKFGTGVWVEYEQGDPEYPIWVGCYWGTAVEVPALAKVTPPGIPIITLETGTSGLSINELPTPPTGGVLIHSGPAASISVTPTIITITAPAVHIKTASFKVNDAVTVTGPPS